MSKIWSRRKLMLRRVAALARGAIRDRAQAAVSALVGCASVASFDRYRAAAFGVQARVRNSVGVPRCSRRPTNPRRSSSRHGHRHEGSLLVVRGSDLSVCTLPRPDVPGRGRGRTVRPLPSRPVAGRNARSAGAGAGPRIHRHVQSTCRRSDLILFSRSARAACADRAAVGDDPRCGHR